MDPIAEQRETAERRTLDWLRASLARDVAVFVVPPAMLAEVHAAVATTPPCAHLQAIPLQPGFILGMAGTAQCPDCFLGELRRRAADARQVCTSCDRASRYRLRQLAVLAGHRTFVLLVCPACALPLSLPPQVTTRPYC